MPDGVDLDCVRDTGDKVVDHVSTNQAWQLIGQKLLDLLSAITIKFSKFSFTFYNGDTVTRF